ncbi:DUF2271 domain-containing protein [Ilumatobacter sp.]|uniref:DUF2271 domain-containing protein n=1 Tax=Ilumatobacter sp. TaxID=1967498 RepID=UPI003C52E81A
MISTRPLQTRYATTTRRTIFRQAALAALIVVPGMACGNNDAEVFGSATTQSSPTTADTTTTDAPLTPAADTTSAPVAETPTETTVASVDASVDPATFPAAAELAVSFSFVPESTDGRGIESPYIAVWVEDLDGNLVQTISLWYEQSGRGDRWLSDLPQWYSASGQGSDVTMSSATQVAGDYTVAWDGTGFDGQPVAQGDYVLFVEAAREHGPYEITSQQITIGDEPFTVALADDGELANLSATLFA